MFALIYPSEYSAESFFAFFETICVFNVKRFCMQIYSEMAIRWASWHM